MAAEPLSAKKQRLRPAGAMRVSSSASFTAGLVGEAGEDHVFELLELLAYGRS
jgi:hypothetical protein